MRSLDAIIADTLHGEGKIRKIAEKTGMKAGTLYRYGLPPETSGLDIPLRKLTAILRAAGDYTVLRRLAAECGFLVVREPRTPAGCRDQNELISRLQKSAADAVCKTMDFLELQTSPRLHAAEDALDDTAASACGIKRMIRRRGQLELAL